MTHIISLAEAVTITPRTDIEVVRLVEAAKAHVPQIIRTVEELEALDPETLVQPSAPEGFEHEVTRAESLLYVVSRWGWKEHLPAVVIATGNQVRAAREAMEQEHE